MRHVILNLAAAVAALEAQGALVVYPARREPTFDLNFPKIEKESRVRDWEQREKPKHRKRRRVRR